MGAGLLELDLSVLAGLTGLADLTIQVEGVAEDVVLLLFAGTGIFEGAGRLTLGRCAFLLLSVRGQISSSSSMHQTKDFRR